MKNQKGITLVALVVTIVVLLILAGITIAYVLQGDSIFGAARDAQKQTREGDVKTAIALAMGSVQTDYYTSRNKFATLTTENTAEKAAYDTLVKDLTGTGITLPATPTAFDTIETGTDDAKKVAFKIVLDGVTYDSKTYKVTIDSSAATKELQLVVEAK